MVNSDDTGQSLPDTQYVVFSLAAIIYFVGALIDNLHSYAKNACAEGVNTTIANPCVDAITLPDIPPALLGLTSLAALTYVGAKTVAREGMRIMDMTPRPVAPGATLTIVLVNVPKSLAQTSAFVTFAPNPPTAGGGPLSPNAASLQVEGVTTRLGVIAPNTPGDYLVAVTTPAGTTPPVDVRVEAPA